MTRSSAMTRWRPGHMWAPKPKGREALRKGRGRPSLRYTGSSLWDRKRLYLQFKLGSVCVIGGGAVPAPVCVCVCACVCACVCVCVGEGGGT